MTSVDEVTLASGPSARAADTLPDALDGAPTVVARAGDPTDVAYAVRYRAQRPLGRGGMGEVHSCTDAKIGREVAVKVMLAKAAQDHRARERFLREGRVQAQLEHPGIVPVYDIGITPTGAPSMAMKRVKGTTLEEVIRRLRDGDPEMERRHPRASLLFAMERVCETVAYAHARGVVHRDLKPANIMLGEFGEVNVLDWGLAKLHGDTDIAAPELASDDDFTVPGSIVGTVSYMSPEQAAGDPVDTAADVYALGAILYEAVTLERLHPSSTLDERLGATLRGVDARPSSRVPGVAPELDEICVRATKVLRAERYAHAGELLADLRNFSARQRASDLRREMADHHARAAWSTLRGGHASSEDVRATALRELGAAAVLDPNNPEMIRMIEQLLSPGAKVPPEVKRELAAANERTASVAMERSAITYAAALLLLPLVAWMGVRSWTMFTVLAGGIALSAITSIVLARSGRSTGLAVWIAAPGAFAVVSTLDALCSSLLFMPAFVVTTIVAFITTVRPSPALRMFLLACGLTAILGPALASLVGITPPALRFEDGMIQILPRLAALPALPTTALLVITSTFLVTASTLLTGRAIDSLRVAERRLAVQAHRLRSLLPRPNQPSFTQT